MKKTLKMVCVLSMAALLMGEVVPMRAEDGQKNGQAAQIRLRTTLAGAAIQGKKPGGNADFRNDSSSRMRLNVEVENVNLPAGTILTVAVVHAGVSMTVGTIKLGSTGESELELNFQNGAVVPAIASGDMVTVSNGMAVILAGAF
uniref:Uncharacterized protein n=1 Tax=Solibacter usitatus (strain Ellin6076) TaxID=234267 RepID=Q01RC1_SOLUE